jgi:predicted ribosomally synthesized peptide with SipW-like signal peptide
MRKILSSLMVIGIAATLLGAGTLSYFSDWEISTDNIIQAGTIDLKVDCNSTWWRNYNELGDVGPTLKGEINFPLRDLTVEKFFNWSDIKPGDWGEVTLSFHLYSNPGWIWFHINNTMDYENGFSEPERWEDPTPNIGDLSQFIYTFLWLDEGRIPGFQGKDIDPWEGNNIFDEWEDATGYMINEPVVYGIPYVEDATFYDMYAYDCCWMGPWDIENCTTYYIGWYWWVPTWVGNIIQGDSFEFDIEFFVEQIANNPNPVPPGPICDGD